MVPDMRSNYVATPRETVVGLLESAGRIEGDVPIRTSFVQQGSQKAPLPGPLATLIRHGDRRGLDLFLLLKAVASAAPYNSHRGAAVWARALRHTGVTANEQTISKIWQRLDRLGLVTRSKSGRLANITLLHESGSKEVYVHPAQARDRYFKLPVAYWLDKDDKWSSTLRLPAKAMLLVALSLRPGFVLPVEKVPAWYGMSADTAQRGLAELVQRNILKRARVAKKAPLAPQGFTYDSHYTLQGDFYSAWDVSNDN